MAVIPATPAPGTNWEAWGNAVALAVSQVSLNPTTLVTGNYTAAIHDYVLVDSTSGALTVTLPAAPVDGTKIAVKKVDSSGNAVTIARGGTDAFNTPGGSVAVTLSHQNHQMEFFYVAARTSWVISDSPSMAYIQAQVDSLKPAYYPTKTAALAAGAFTQGRIVGVGSLA